MGFKYKIYYQLIDITVVVRYIGYFWPNSLDHEITNF